MTKQELSGYLVNLLAIIDSKEDVGLDRGGALAREYTRGYEQLTAMIRKEEEDEARKSERSGIGYEDRTEIPSSESGRSSAVGEQGWASSSRRADV